MEVRIPTVVGLYVALTALVTWPQVLHLHGVTDFGDPLHFSWTLAWVAHAVVAAPGHLFDANVLFPERYTLAYSETMLLPGLLLAPIMWAGGDAILAQNFLLLSAYVLSGLAMFVLVRSLTSDDAAALVAGAIFAVYPYRIEKYPQVQMQLVFWMPLAFWALHRILAKPNWRDSVSLGVFLAAQCYTCVTYAIYGAILLPVVGGVSLFAVPGSQRWPAVRALGLSVIIAVVLAAPIALVYRAASGLVGERTVADLEVYRADLGDYLRAHPDGALYGDVTHPGRPERRLFPGYAGPALAIAAFVPPFGIPALAYAASGVVAVDLSLGLNGPGYRWVYDHFAPFRGLRVPARFAMLVGMVMAVLAGLGVARIGRGRGRATRLALVAAAISAVTLEARMRPLELVSLPDSAPPVYAWLAAQPPSVVCEYPVGNLQGRVGPQDPTYMYYSTLHWQRLVNGDMGFQPTSYRDLLNHLRSFPDDEAIGYLRRRGVTILLVHSAFYITGDFDADVRKLRTRPDLDWVGAFRWRSGDVTHAFRVKNE